MSAPSPTPTNSPKPAPTNLPKPAPTPVDLPRLRSTLGQPELGRLVDALQRRLELGRPLEGRLTLVDATASERTAFDALLGRVSRPGASLGIDLGELVEVLHDAGICADLTTAVHALRGPVDDRRALAERHQAVWTAVLGTATARFAAWPPLQNWLGELAASGLLKRLCDDQPACAASLVDELARLATALPVHAEPLATLAARLFGDAHALDPGTPRATLALRLAARLGGVELDDDAEGRRTAWASVGVLCDELSTPVLVFNLPAQADTPLTRLLATARRDGEPLHLSLRHLLVWPLAGDPGLAGRTVFVCENPTIVALAVRRLGVRCAPLVCVNGQFATPAKVLLRQLAAAGARLRYHGDFDLGGLTIARRVLAEPGALPWRMSPADYLSAPKGKKLATREGLTSPWCPELAEVMKQNGNSVHEEAVVESLLADLAG
ncbi:MAG: TIGR02679 family protein [Opitutus sp.]|nr:TIGR02679 family protein [Opitutus sp.]MCS6247184.1 TIGR02679 family protein [Opitutus sp.]MCS6274073.1 TIGR02679 family protein [Opitutus sp.]MCS6276349.1 TIGR02679 family protein [Opitutus sp.]MCS6302003.1 TIGR02679 family protein [Opitutus sp.]